jgi:hypothetical protein
MGSIERASGSREEGPFDSSDSMDRLEQPAPPRKLSNGVRKAKCKKLLTAIGKNVVGNLGNIAVIITIAILANQIRQDLNTQQAEVARLQGQTTALQGILVESLNTTSEIKAQAAALQGKITLFETLFTDSRQAELQTLLNDLRTVNASLSEQLKNGTFTLSNGLVAITSNLSTAVSTIQTVANSSLSALQTFNSTAVTQQNAILIGTQAAALVSTNVSQRMNVLETCTI